MEKIHDKDNFYKIYDWAGPDRSKLPWAPDEPQSEIGPTRVSRENIQKFFAPELKELLTILCLVLLVSCSPPPEIPTNKLVERQGITYEVNSTTPFTGTSIEFFENGQPKEKRDYKDGKEDGPYEMYHENGQVEKRGHVEDGKEEGLWEHYFKNGQFYKLIKVRVDPEKPHGLSELFYEDGLLREKGDYKDGELEGPQERFYENGQLEYRGKYKTGQRDGTWMYFDEEGNLTKTEEWENEKLIK